MEKPAGSSTSKSTSKSAAASSIDTPIGIESRLRRPAVELDIRDHPFVCDKDFGYTFPTPTLPKFRMLVCLYDARYPSTITVCWGNSFIRWRSYRVWAYLRGSRSASRPLEQRFCQG